jgi:hypothetical protein
MNLNVASQNNGLVMWTGTAARPIDLRHHVNFSMTIQVNAAIGADTKLQFEWAPPSDADPCLPGAWHPVEEVLTCSARWGEVSTDRAEIVIPKDTPVGSICSAALPCKPGAFIRVAPAAGDVGDVTVVAVLSGPK